MAVRVLVASVAAGVLLALPAGGTAAGSAPLRVTIVGDSVAASLDYVSSARARLRPGMTLQLNLKVCRRLVAASCPYNGHAPTTALQAVRAYGRSLGDVLVVDVGYNEDGRDFPAGIDLLMHAALAQGASHVVWVTLREESPLYRPANAAIRQATKRWPQLVVADWNAYSRGRPWFREDGLHLTPTGAEGLAAFLREHVLEAAGR